MRSTPPDSAASANSARSPRSRRASVQRYSRAVGEALAGIQHDREVSPDGDLRVMWTHHTGVPGPGTESGPRQPLPSHLIRVMPAKGAGMPSDRNGRSLAVVGGGVIGLSVARRAALDGWSVRVHRTEEQRRLLGGGRHARAAQRGLAG